MILNILHTTELEIIASYDHIGGAAPVDYRQWRRWEAMRGARLLKFNKRRNVRWDRTFYNITEAGRRAVVASEHRG